MRVKAVEPGITATELGEDATHRASRAALEQVRETVTPIAAEDIADAIAFAVAAPPQVNVAELVMLPTRQG